MTLKLINHRVTKIEANVNKTEGPVRIGTVNNNAKPVKIDVKDGTNKNKIVIVEYEYIVRYNYEGTDDNAFANIKLEGNLTYTTNEKEGEEIKNNWEAGKPLKDEQFIQILQGILNYAQVEAIIISRELGLPLPVQLSKVEKKK